MMLGLQQPASCSRTVYMTMRTDRPIQCVFFHCNLLVCVSLPFYCVFIAVISFYLVVSVSTKYLILYVLPVVFNKRLLQALAYRLYSMLCDKQLTAGDCGRLLPPNLHCTPRYCAETVIVIIKKYPFKKFYVATTRDCNPGAVFSIPGLTLPGSRDPGIPEVSILL